MGLRSPSGAASLAVLLGLTLLPASVLTLTPDASASPRATVATAPATPAQEAEEQLARVRVPTLDWQPCPELVDNDRVTCTTIRAPLDYDHPRGPTTPLALVKVSADTASRGSLFVNPGGPGGSSRYFALAAGRLLGQRIDRYYDIIGIDPRGVGDSGRAVCRGRTGGRVYSPFYYPIGVRQVAQQVRIDDNLRLLCKRGASALVDHAGTADNARDMDLVRRALGEDQLTYYGISYGSYLGATYAALFPDHIRAMVVDGVLDPVAWSSGPTGRPASLPFTTRIRSGEGAYEALFSAFNECDRVGRAHCSLAPDSASKFRKVYAASRSGLQLGDERVRPQDVIGTGLSALYYGPYIKQFFQLLHFTLRFIDSPAGSAAPRAATRRAVGAEARAARLYRHLSRVRDRRAADGLYAWDRYPRSAAVRAAGVRAAADVVFQAVGCADSRNPRAPLAWERAARLTDQQSPYFGRLWSWGSSACARQGIATGQDAFRGPWRTATSYPLLVVGNTHDPATPVSGARRVNSLFDDSVLLLYNGWGHGALGTVRCIRTTVADYLVSRELPPDGTVCQPNRELFNARAAGRP